MNSNLKYHDIKQNTDEWEMLRRGKMTASSAGIFLVNGTTKYKIESGEFAGNEIGLGVQAVEYIYQKAGERIAKTDNPGFSNFATERGHDLEPLAIRAYEEETYQEVHEIGFVELDEFIGFSPDGMVSDIHGVEIKCLMHTKHMKIIDCLENIDKDHFAQIQFMLAVTDCEYWDLVNFHPEFNKNRLIIRKVNRDETVINRLKMCMDIFRQEVKRLVGLDVPVAITETV